MFKMELETGSDAFVDESGPLEVARILEDVAKQLIDGYTSGYPRDYNGNTVGYWRWTPEEAGTE